ncbi:hypothetical protein [Candidatus Binatus sp.]|uniref:hypothetical protein n=1 Tax=Candidatus Binatus sp. TaxID=2811406 RepID=UPI003C432B04
MLSVLLKLKMARLSAGFVAGCLLVVAPGIVLGQEFGGISVPIPVELDGQPTHCRLYLKLETKSYNLPFEKFAAGPMDSAQTMFATAVDAIRKDDAAKFASVWTSPDQMKRLSQVTVTLADNSTDSWIKVARSNFDFDKLTVVAEVLVGSETMFIWDAPTRAGIQRNAFYIGLDQKNQLRLSAVSSNSPVEPLILNAFVAARTDPAVYKPISNINVDYQYPIPLAGPGDAGAHPAFFEFDGAPMDFPIGDEKIKAPTPLLEFLRNAAFAIRSGKDKSFASDFTPRSRETIGQWLAATEKREQAKQRSRASASPASNYETAGLISAMMANVKFVLNADPIFLVFQARGSGDKWMPQALSYSYVLREGGTYKIANFSSMNTLDDFLQNPALFDKNILKQALKK